MDVKTAESRPRIPRNVWLLGCVSFFTDVASEMLYPVIPLFLTASLGASPAVLGLVDGLAEGIGSGLRWLGGALSDKLGKRKPFIFAGYGISALSKPVMGAAAVAMGWPLFLIGRCADRLGKSIRTSSRDALIAASTEPAIRGYAFGFHRMMDTAGAVTGPLIALLVICLLAGTHATFSAGWGAHAEQSTLHDLPFKWLFFGAIVPGIVSVLCISIVKEIPPKESDERTNRSIFQPFGAEVWRLVLATFVFSLGNSSDTFLILRSSQLGLGFGWIVLLYAMYNVVYAAASTPLGKLSDKIGQKPIIIAGWLIYALVYLGFATMHATWAPWILLGVYGLYQAMTDGVTKAMVSNLAPDYQRAGAMGLVNTASGFGQLIASVVAGSIWSYAIFGGRMMLPFVIGAAMALAAVPIIASVHKSPRTSVRD
jgi:MFS family permease